MLVSQVEAWPGFSPKYTQFYSVVSVKSGVGKLNYKQVLRIFDIIIIITSPLLASFTTTPFNNLVFSFSSCLLFLVEGSMAACNFFAKQFCSSAIVYREALAAFQLPRHFQLNRAA